MPKRGQQHVDRPGRNHPDKSQDMVTGTPKKQETYKEQAAQHKNPGAVPPVTKAPHDHPHQGHSLEAESRIQTDLPQSRSGSDSNAHGHRKGSDLGASHGTRQPAGHEPDAEDFDRDLHPNVLAGQNTGSDAAGAARQTAYDRKELHALLPGFTADELRAISILPAGARLQQGATYLDLKHRDRGEVHAMADMVAEPDSYYVAKKEMDYVLWNRLIGVTEPARLDEAEESR